MRARDGGRSLRVEIRADVQSETLVDRLVADALVARPSEIVEDRRILRCG